MKVSEVSEDWIVCGLDERVKLKVLKNMYYYKMNVSSAF